LALVVAGFLCLLWFPTHAILEWQADLFPGNNWINGWFRWDAFWYLAIANPSSRVVPPDLSAANFFPFYAWLSLVVSLPLRVVMTADHAFAAGALAVSHASFFFALVGVHRLTSALVDSAAADRTVWLMACFPFSFFFGAAYSDALYLCLSVWAFVFARERRWPAAAALGALAAMTRIPGVALVAALIVEYARREGVKIGRREITMAAILAVAPIAIALYFSSRYGDPLAFLHARQEGWQRATGPLAAMSRDLGEFFAGPAFACGSLKDCFAGWELTSHILGVWYLALIPMSLILVATRASLLGPGLTFWVVASILMAAANGLDGTGRFTAVLFPVFIAAATRLRSRLAVAAVCAFCAPFLLLFVFQFARWRPVL
jgi:hypothetical protein